MHETPERILLGSGPALRWMPRPLSASRAETSQAQQQSRQSSLGTACETTPAARNGHGRSSNVLPLTRARQTNDGRAGAEILDRARPDNARVQGAETHHHVRHRGLKVSDAVEHEGVVCWDSPLKNIHR